MTVCAHPLEKVSQLSVEAFHRDYVSARRPVVLSQLVSHWSSVRSWAFDTLRQRFGAAEVTTIRTNAGKVIMDAERGAQEVRTSLAEFLAAIEAGRKDLYLTTRLSLLPAEMSREVPTPELCSGATWQTGNLWIGAAGTLARMHRDLADNLHTVVTGSKRFTLVAPRQSRKLYPHGIFDTFPNGCRVDIEAPDVERFPRVADIEVLTTDLHAGDAIYIPRRWWHHVRTLEQTVSVNYWWASGMQFAIVRTADLFKQLRGISR